MNAVDQFIRTTIWEAATMLAWLDGSCKGRSAWAQISYNRRIMAGWDLMPVRAGSEWESHCQRGKGTKKRGSSRRFVRSYKAEMKVHGGWSANQRQCKRRKRPTPQEKDLYSRWTAAGGLPSCPEQRSATSEAGDQRETCGEDGASDSPNPLPARWGCAKASPGAEAKRCPRLHASAFPPAQKRPMDQRQTFTMRWPKSSSGTAQQNLRQRKPQAAVTNSESFATA